MISRMKSTRRLTRVVEETKKKERTKQATEGLKHLQASHGKPTSFSYGEMDGLIKFWQDKAIRAATIEEKNGCEANVKFYGFVKSSLKEDGVFIQPGWEE